MMASPRPDHKQIVFVQRTSAYEDFQLYIADVEENLVSNFDPKSMTSVNKEAISNMQLLGYVELDGQLGRARLRWVVFKTCFNLSILANTTKTFTSSKI